MSSGRKRGRPKRKAQRRAKWQHEKRFSKKSKQRSPRHVVSFVTIAREVLHEGLRPLHEDDYIVHANDWPDGHPQSPYRKEA